MEWFTSRRISPEPKQEDINSFGFDEETKAAIEELNLNPRLVRDHNERIHIKQCQTCSAYRDQNCWVYGQDTLKTGNICERNRIFTFEPLEETQ